MVLRIESGDAQVSGERWHNCLLLAADMDPFALVERAVAAAAAMSGRPYIIACRMSATCPIVGSLHSTIRHVAGRETGTRSPHAWTLSAACTDPYALS